MTDLLLSLDQHAHLSTLIGRRVRQLVWDLNAIYFVGETGTLKVEAEIRVPPSPAPDEFDEAACLSVGRDFQSSVFRDEGEQGYWYRVVATDILIEQVEVVRTGLVMPEERICRLRSSAPPGSLVVPCDCGILITTSKGVLPAVQTENAYGFHNWPEVKLYKRREVEEQLDDRYDVVKL